jgi:predicted lipoprotein with Yx(FWY)xxD motif
MNRTFLISALAAAFLTPGTLAGVTHAAGYVLAVATSGEHGRYLVDPEGRSLYLFEADTRGQGNRQAVSACYEACAEVWPPLIVETAFEAGANPVGTTVRNDGRIQVTYNGWPLYYYVRDQRPGQTTGHDIEDFGAEWYLLTPEGERVGGEAAQGELQGQEPQGQGQTQGQPY